MAWSTSVRVVDEDGEPVSGAKVSFIFSFWDGFETKYTDDDGWAEFEYESIDSDKRMWVDDFYVQDERVAGDYYAENGDTQSFTVT